MLRIRQWILGVLLLVCSSLQAQEFNQNYYYTPDELPNACIYLPAPPAFDSQVFEDDFQQWIWGKSVRDTERGKMASKDSELTFQKMAKIYGEILGITISEKETPAIWKFMVRAGDTGHAAVKKAKERYMRVRPFALMNENLAGEFDVDSALRKIRENACAVNDDNQVTHVVGMAVGIFDRSGKLCASISCSVSESQATKKKKKELLAALHEISQQLTELFTKENIII